MEDVVFMFMKQPLVKTPRVGPRYQVTAADENTTRRLNSGYFRGDSVTTNISFLQEKKTRKKIFCFVFNFIVQNMV
jgi:ssRNA-specific RNase YbeY (16S rRNA maturation enzyme)